MIDQRAARLLLDKVRGYALADVEILSVRIPDVGTRDDRELVRTR